ncbi:hypothetical protein COCSADRAFT_300718 [Bipolaris sorokiniana ND90Pr]|uniref:Uncharacterized protein n=1 Tax=Cochliobolus sativus (strain ND90Pr / ATCC 201652) TaxID=665912 RepID=M2SHH4_COCSN|nr:uncharacterized protein COCSADRAFT_300718 [Bipolaris sorokiniana ND90Pr]EMD66653.1 hypothetical protein COCSADRAFT_300718 [Bipolaris sorokiniana ND90Pr]
MLHKFTVTGSFKVWMALFYPAWRCSISCGSSAVQRARLSICLVSFSFSSCCSLFFFILFFSSFYTLCSI